MNPILLTPESQQINNYDKELEPPGPCFLCSAKTWKNGTRVVHNVCKTQSGIESSVEEVRIRVKCSNRECLRRNRTLYGNTAYPYRRFHLEVVVSALLEWLGGELRYICAQKFHCSGDSLWRWTRWIYKLMGNTNEMEGFCGKLSKEGVPFTKVNTEIPNAMYVLHLFDCLATVLDERKVALPLLGHAGVIRLLKYLLQKRHEIFWITKPSPPLRAQWEHVCM